MTALQPKAVIRGIAKVFDIAGALHPRERQRHDRSVHLTLTIDRRRLDQDLKAVTRHDGQR